MHNGFIGMYPSLERTKGAFRGTNPWKRGAPEKAYHKKVPLGRTGRFQEGIFFNKSRTNQNEISDSMLFDAAELT